MRFAHKFYIIDFYQMTELQTTDVSGILTISVYSTNLAPPKFRHPIKVYNVKHMDESHPTDKITADAFSGILPLDRSYKPQSGSENC